jgi:hypothetical protein
MSLDEIIASICDMERQLADLKAALLVMRLEQQAGGFDLTPPEPEPVAKPKRASQMPPGWAPNHNDLQWAEDSYPNVKVRDETDKFRDWCIARGQTYKNWSAAYRNWIRNAARFATADVTRLQGRPQGRAAALAETNRERRDRALDKLSALRDRTAGGEV